MQRQHSVPLLLPSGSGGAVLLNPVAQQAGGDAVSEAYIQALVHEHPASLPIAGSTRCFHTPEGIQTRRQCLALPGVRRNEIASGAFASSVTGIPRVSPPGRAEARGEIRINHSLLILKCYDRNIFCEP